MASVGDYQWSTNTTSAVSTTDYLFTTGTNTYPNVSITPSMGPVTVTIAPEAPKPEGPLQWLRREVEEITELAWAA